MPLALSLPASAADEFVLEDPIEAHPGAFRPAVTLDGNGGALAAWGTCMVEVSRSSDNGVSWSAPRPIAGYFAPSLNFAFELTAGDGTWLLVWQSNDAVSGLHNVLYSRSLDNGTSWTTPTPLSTPALVTSEFPAVATDGAGSWVVVWRSRGDMMAVRSADGGATWTAPKRFGLTGTTIDFEIEADLATDRNGTWIAVWPEYVGFFQWDIRYARSTDAGATWSVPSFIGAGTVANQNPSIAADGVGNWMVVWDTRDADSVWNELDIVSSRSTDGGLTWSAGQAVNSNFDSDGTTAQDELPQVESDGHGNWLVFWRLDTEQGSYDHDVMGARSRNLGVSWTAPQPVAASSVSDLWHGLTTDRRGNWLLSWTTSGFLQPTHSLLAHFRPRFPLSCASDLDGDGFGAAGEVSCPLGTAIDCDDTDFHVTPAATPLCDGSNNDCTHGAWPFLTGTNEFDDDGDLIAECSGDCDDTEAQLWSAAGDGVALVLGRDALGAALLSWTVLDAPGGAPGMLRFDTLRNSGTCAPYICKGSCMATATCLESDGADTTSFDSESPDSGEVFFYSVRAENDCGTASGRLPLCP